MGIYSSDRRQDVVCSNVSQPFPFFWSSPHPLCLTSYISFPPHLGPLPSGERLSRREPLLSGEKLRGGTLTDVERWGEGNDLDGGVVVRDAAGIAAPSRNDGVRFRPIDLQGPGLHPVDDHPPVIFSELDRKSTRLNSSHQKISYAV